MNRSTTIGFSVALLAHAFATTAVAAPLVDLSKDVQGGYFVITPDNARIVFQSESNYILYSARVDGSGTPAQLTPYGVEPVVYAAISPDSSQIVFNGGVGVGESALSLVSVYSRPIDGGGEPVLLNTAPDLPDGAFGYYNAISPDSRRVLMRVSEPQEYFYLLSRPIDASAPAVRLSSPTCDPDTIPCSSSIGVADFAFAGNRAVFVETDGNYQGRLFGRVLDGSLPAVQISSETESAGGFAITPDASRVIFTGSNSATGHKVYNSSLIDGSSVLLATLTGPRGGFALAPDGRQVVLLEGNSHLLTVPADGSVSPKPLESSPNGVRFLGFSPDSTLVAFIPEGTEELWVSPSDASAAARRLATNAGIQMAFSSNSRRLVYGAGELTNRQLYSVGTDGASAPMLLASYPKYFDFVVTPDSSAVVVAVNSDDDLRFDAFYLIPIDGGPPRLIAESPYADGGIQTNGWALTADGSRLIFATYEGFAAREIYAVAIPEPGWMFAMSVTLLLLRRGRRGVAQCNEFS
jgi:Tol biopolymer transport system component